MKQRIAGLAASWLPVLVIYVSILILVPYGRLLSQSLYRLWPDTVQSERALPVVADSLAMVPTGAAICRLGELWWLPTGGEAVAVDLPAQCGKLGFHKMSDRLAVPALGRSELLVVELGSEELVVTRRPTSGRVTASLAVGGRIAAGTASGALHLWDEGRAPVEISVSSMPIRDVHPSGDTLLVATADELVQVGTDGGQVRVLHRAALGADALALSRVKDRVFVATRAEVVSLRVPPDGSAEPRIVDRVPIPSTPVRVHTFLSTASAVVLQDGGAHILREDGAGRIWWGVQGGVRGQAVDCTGGWGRISCVTRDGRLVELDRYPSKDALIVSVGVLGLLAVLGLLLTAILGGRGALVRRVLVSVGALGALGWVLSGTWGSPIESLHVLEYGAIGALTFRALARQVGGGWTAAALAVVLGFGFGLGDETFQAVFPSRTGSMEDVILDTQAVSIGVVLAWAGLGLGDGRPSAPAWPVPGAIAVMVLGAALFLTFAQGFSDTWSAGRLTWISRLSPDETRQLDAEPDRAAVLERGVLMDYGDYLRAFEHDPFFYELRVRLFRRDKRLERGDLAVACGEHAIVQTLFPNTVAATSFAWEPAQRAACDEYAATPYTSPVGGDRITWASIFSLWMGALGLVLAGLIACVALARRGRAAATSDP